MTGRWTRRRMLSWSIKGAVAALLAKGGYNTMPASVELTRVDVRLARLPAAFRGLRIAQLTDLHASAIVSNELQRQAAELCMRAQPDLIVLTGDFISGATRFLSGSVGEFERKHLDQSLVALSALKAPLGLYAVLGNHDFWSGPTAVDAITAAYTATLGVRWLRNSNVRLERQGAFIQLLGIDDYWEASCSLDVACKGLDAQAPRILLSHNPDVNEEIELGKTSIDLVISGHTHGGQVVLPLLGQPVMPSKFGQKYRVGLVRDGERQTFVSRGIGHLLAPVRFNCPPEVALITLV